MTRFEKFTTHELEVLHTALTDSIESGLSDEYEDNVPTLDSLYDELQDELSLRDDREPYEEYDEDDEDDEEEG